MKLLSLVIPFVLVGVAVADAPKPAAPKTTAPRVARIEVAVTKQGFAPDNITVPANQPVTLVFTRKTEETCTRSVVVTVSEGKTIERALPLDKAVEIAVTFPKAGTLGYACSMKMNKGVIVVQ
ncbi:MAG: cupredoxin domain-containing protein [Proteobacteria bacterium]|nr:cupredoxin domain-containing protein [Pseudomonadota bacterium]